MIKYETWLASSKEFNYVDEGLGKWNCGNKQHNKPIATMNSCLIG